MRQVQRPDGARGTGTGSRRRTLLSAWALVTLLTAVVLQETSASAQVTAPVATDSATSTEASITEAVATVFAAVSPTTDATPAQNVGRPATPTASPATVPPVTTEPESEPVPEVPATIPAASTVLATPTTVPASRPRTHSSDLAVPTDPVQNLIDSTGILDESEQPVHPDVDEAVKELKAEVKAIADRIFNRFPVDTTTGPARPPVDTTTGPARPPVDTTTGPARPPLDVCAAPSTPGVPVTAPPTRLPPSTIPVPTTIRPPPTTSPPPTSPPTTSPQTTSPPTTSLPTTSPPVISLAVAAPSPVTRSSSEATGGAALIGPGAGVTADPACLPDDPGEIEPEIVVVTQDPTPVTPTAPVTPVAPEPQIQIVVPEPDPIPQPAVEPAGDTPVTLTLGPPVAFLPVAPAVAPPLTFVAFPLAPVPSPITPVAVLPDIEFPELVPALPPTGPPVIASPPDVRAAPPPSLRPLLVRGVGAGRPSALPGGLAEATGTDCPASSAVTLRIEGREVARTTANAAGSFSAQLPLPSDLQVGRRLVTATCGPVSLEGPLSLVQTSSNLNAGAGITTLAALLSLFLLIVLVVRSTQNDRRPQR